MVSLERSCLGAQIHVTLNHGSAPLKVTAVIPKEDDSQQLIMDKTADSNVESPAAMILGKRST